MNTWPINRVFAVGYRLALAEVSSQRAPLENTIQKSPLQFSIMPYYGLRKPTLTETAVFDAGLTSEAEVSLIPNNSWKYIYA